MLIEIATFHKMQTRKHHFKENYIYNTKTNLNFFFQNKEDYAYFNLKNKHNYEGVCNVNLSWAITVFFSGNQSNDSNCQLKLK